MTCILANIKGTLAMKCYWLENKDFFPGLVYDTFYVYVTCYSEFRLCAEDSTPQKNTQIKNHKKQRKMLPLQEVDEVILNILVCKANCQALSRNLFAPPTPLSLKGT